MTENLLYLLLSVTLSSSRNIASKKTAADAREKSDFFFSQSTLFLAAALILAVFNFNKISTVASLTVIYGVIYGILLVLSQFMFTLALKKGNTSICTVIYSLGFILPTLSGAIFWSEEFTVTNFIGLLIAIATIILTMQKNDDNSNHNKSFMFFIITAMFASGGLGIMQKVQQSSSVAEQKGMFLITAFLFAFVFSLISFLICRKPIKLNVKNAFYPSLTGICFGGANLCNTILAGRMKSAVFFPVQNISTILLSTFLGLAVFREKITLKTAAIIILGIIVVVIFSI
ncbi:MAG: GRP family sugar transporter [Acutalibacteraceae bacterium]